MKTEREENKVENDKEVALRKDPGFWREVWQQIRLVWRLVRDPEVPIYLKILPLLTVIYLLIPLDLLPDVLIGLGQLDDLTVLLVGSKLFVEFAPPHIVSRHMQDIRVQDGYAPHAAHNALTADDPDAIAETIIIDAEHEVVLSNKPQAGS
ncbi:MAG: DUF1232 domain-containing protein [Anaerolinea sp.]|nr:DUF1232 domain-containing protein [Anaerolinea sp.]